MKVLINIIIGSLFILSHVSFSAKNKQENPINITIKSIQMGPMKGDKEPSDFSVLIDFINNKSRIDQWKFGFYMPATSFYQLVNSHHNPKLSMQICDKQNTCSPLIYETANNIREPDLSQGYTNIFAPSIPFPLLPNHDYTIKLLNNNQSGGRHISVLPQNLFFIVSDQKKIHNIDTTIDTYHIVDYDPKNTKLAIKNHIKANWDKSIPASSSKNTIVPSVVYIDSNEESRFLIQDGLSIHNQFNQDNRLALMLGTALLTDLKVHTTVDKQTSSTSGIIIKKLLNSDKIKNNLEGYILDIQEKHITIQAIHEAGIYYAFQTLRQLWNNSYTENSITLPQSFILDYPRFKYRGMMVDVSRHFFSVAEIKSFIDLMGAHKLNTLHLHLSDDEAFRVALPLYPTLSTIANRRGFGLPMGATMFPQGNLYKSYQSHSYIKVNDIYQGYYTPSDITDIVEYANKNQITVIPEIDFPSHSRALIKSLPTQLIDPDDISSFVSAQGYTDNTLPVCTYHTSISVGPIFTRTIDSIVNSIANLFSGQTTAYAINNEISIGGDEVSPDAWTKSPSCQQEWKKLSALQKSHKFFQLMALENSTIILSGWQQFIQTDNTKLGNTIVPANKVGHVWVWNTSNEAISQASSLAKHGYPTVLAYADQMYFDIAYTPDIHEPGLTWANSYSDTQGALSSTISAKYTMKKTAPLHKKNILGLEGALWSENLANYQQMIYMALPKMAGLSEASWADEVVTSNRKKVNWQSLAQRLGCGKTGFLAYLNKLYPVSYRGYPKGIWLEVPPHVCHED